MVHCGATVGAASLEGRHGGCSLAATGCPAWRRTGEAAVEAKAEDEDVALAAQVHSFQVREACSRQQGRTDAGGVALAQVSAGQGSAQRLHVPSEPDHAAEAEEVPRQHATTGVLPRHPLRPCANVAHPRLL